MRLAQRAAQLGASASSALRAVRLWARMNKPRPAEGRLCARLDQFRSHQGPESCSRSQDHAPACCAATRTMPPHRTRRRCYIAPAAAPKGPLLAVSSFSSRCQCAVAPVGDPLALGCVENRLSVHWPHAGQPAPVCTRGPKGRGRRRGAAREAAADGPGLPRAGKHF